MPRIRAAAAVAAMAAALAACDDPLFYAKVDATSVDVTQRLPTVPAAPAVDVPDVTLVGIPVSFQLGDILVSEVTEKSRLTLNSARLVMLAPAGGASFAGIRVAAIRVTGPPGSALAPAVVASYDRASDGAAGTTLPFRGSDVDMLPYLNAGTLLLDITGGGTPPGGAWTADLTLDVHALARVGWP